MIDIKSVTRRLVRWVADHFENNAGPGSIAVIGISGGKDSSVAAALCAAALGKERVLGVLLPRGIQDDIDTAYDLCGTLGIPFVEINIEKPAQALLDGVAASGLELSDIAAVNTPARMRMAALYAVSGIVGGRVVCTSNLSEDWVGYSTKFGDSAGDLAPLAQLTVTEVKAVGRELGLSPAFTDKVPLDGLCGLTDEENLGFTYDVLDRYIREGICEDAVTKAKIDRLHVMSRHKVEPIPVFTLSEEAEACG
jgi:NAD+ synthase